MAGTEIVVTITPDVSKLDGLIREAVAAVLRDMADSIERPLPYRRRNEE